VALKFRNDTTRLRELLQPIGCLEQALHMEGGVPLGAPGDVRSNGLEVFDRA